MENLVLYRKYRPKSFNEVVGQKHVVQTLTNALEANLISHAYLFAGPRGSGKTTVARLFAKALNCEERKGFEPCNKCLNCREVLANRFPDLIEIDAASNRGVDDIRALKEGIGFLPLRGKYKVFIIDEAHQLTKEAANALLKTLEEPPSHAVFILATTEIQKMIATIVSRCQRFDFRTLKVSEIVGRLEFICQQEKVNIEKSALELIALQAGGSLRDAESLLEQVLTFNGEKGERVLRAEELREFLGMVDLESVAHLLDLILEKKVKESLEYLNDILERGYDPQLLCKTILNYLRQIMLVRAGLEVFGLTQEQKDHLVSQMKRMSAKEIGNFMKVFLEAQNQLKYSPLPQLPLELAIVKLCGVV